MAKSLDHVVSDIKRSEKARKRLLNIAVDIDNTLITLPVIPYLEKQHGLKMKSEDLTHWDFRNLPENIRTDLLAQFKNPEFVCTTHAIVEAYARLRDWKLAGHRIFLITKRAANLFGPTWAQIEREFPGMVEDIAFIAPDDNKKTALKYCRADLFVDDYCVQDGLDLGIPTWLISNADTVYNHSFREDERLNQALNISYVRTNTDARAFGY